MKDRYIIYNHLQLCSRSGVLYRGKFADFSIYNPGQVTQYVPLLKRRGSPRTVVYSLDHVDTRAPLSHNSPQASRVTSLAQGRCKEGEYAPGTRPLALLCKAVVVAVGPRLRLLVNRNVRVHGAEDD